MVNKDVQYKVVYDISIGTIFNDFEGIPNPDFTVMPILEITSNHRVRRTLQKTVYRYTQNNIMAQHTTERPRKADMMKQRHNVGPVVHTIYPEIYRT